MGLYAFLTGFRASFRFKLFMIFTLLTALITSLFSTLYIFSEISERTSRAGDRARLLATQLSDGVRLALFAEDRETLLQMAGTTARYPDINAVTITANDGRVLAEVRRPSKPAANDLLSMSAEVRSMPQGLSPESALTGSDDTSGVRIGTVRVDLDTSGERENTHRLIATACCVSFLFWATVSLLSYLALRQVTRSFNTLVHGLETMQEGNYTVSIPIERDDEAGRATAAVNHLAAALRQREVENARLQEELVNAMRLEVQEEKKQLMAKLIQTNRMTFLGLLASSMAHEINNPNAAIHLAGTYLSRAWKDALPLLQQAAEEEGDFCLGGLPFSAARDELAQSCATIERSTKLIAAVVHDLRSYSLGKPNEFRPDVDLNQVVSNALSVIRAYGHHSDMSIWTDLAPELPSVNASPHKLEQVVVNLLLNALQSLDGGKGRIMVSTAYLPTVGEATITVQDEGEGIPAEHMERLLEPFFSTRLDRGAAGSVSLWPITW